MSGTQCSVTVALICSVTSGIICACGVFLKIWWLNVNDKQTTYGLFTTVGCKNDVCSIGPEYTSSEGWIILVQATSLGQFILLMFAVLMQAVALLGAKRCVLNTASAAIGLACTFSVLEVLVLAPVYMKLSHAYNVHVSVSVTKQHVIYQTLPLGLCAISGTVAIPALICIHLSRKQDSSSSKSGARVV